MIGTRTNKHGRRSGGLLCIYSSNIRVSSETISSRICLHKINKLAIFNVYLPYFKSNKSAQAIEFAETITMLSTMINKVKCEGFEVVAIGDFNVDFHHTQDKPSNAKLLIESMTRETMLPIDIIRQQSINYTHVKNQRGKPTYKWLDHVWVLSKCQPLVNSVRVTDFQGNTSDHLPIVLEYKLTTNENFLSLYKKPTEPRPKLEHEMHHVVSYYSQLVQKNLKENSTLLTRLSLANTT